MITPIQVILSISLVAITFVFSIKVPGRRIIKAGVILLGLAGLMIIFFPGMSTTVANIIGVGRGADLIMYLGFMNIAILYLIQYMKYRSLKEKVTELAREISILSAKSYINDLPDTTAQRTPTTNKANHNE